MSNAPQSSDQHLLPVSRAARLVNVSRGEIQRRIHDGELATFEGMVELSDLARAYPDANFEYSPEIERTRQIRDKAFGKRVLERLMPDTGVLLARVDQLGADLLRLQQRLSACRNQMDRAVQLLSGENAGSGQVLQEAIALLSQVQEPAQDEYAVFRHLSQANMVLRLMSPHIRLLPSEEDFTVEGNDSILEAGLRDGLAINYGCSNGNCGLCRAKVLSGEARQIRHTDYVMSEQEKADGYILMCACAPITDMVLEAGVADSVDELPMQTIVTRVKDISPLSPTVTLLHLQTPRTNRLRFFAGQQVRLQLGEQSITVPVASCPCDDRNLHFHIDLQTRPELDGILSSQIRKGGAVQLQGPEGDFVLDEKSELPLVFIAAGTGFAPIKSLVEHALAQEDGRAIHLYRGFSGDRPYLENQCRMWVDALDNVAYTAVEGDYATLIDKVLHDHPDTTRRQYYLAGPQPLVATADKRLAHAATWHSYTIDA